MAMLRRFAGLLMPAGSPSRVATLGALRNLGLIGEPPPGDYQHWVGTIEPITIPAPTNDEGVSFALTIAVGPKTTQAQLLTTFVSLQNQTQSHWLALLDTSTQLTPNLVQLYKRLCDSEPRLLPLESLGFSAESKPGIEVKIALVSGDKLSKYALSLIAQAFNENPNAKAVIAHSDWLNASRSQRIDPILLGPKELQSVRQFDYFSSFYAIGTDVELVSVQRELVQGRLDVVAVVDHVLLHRNFVSGPRQTLLDRQDPQFLIDNLGNEVSQSPLVCVNPALGTHVRYKSPEKARVGVITTGCTNGESSGGGEVSNVISSRVAQPGVTPVSLGFVSGHSCSQVLSYVTSCEFEYVLVIDKRLTLSAAHLNDLVGVLENSGSSIVVPIVLGVDGRVLDAGISESPRYGTLNDPTKGLGQARLVGDISGRVFVAKTSNLKDYMERSLSGQCLEIPLFARHLGLECLVWPHATATYCLNLPIGTTKPNAYFSSDWFGVRAS